MKKAPTKSVRMWLARDENNSLCLYNYKPEKETSTNVWESQLGQMMRIDNRLFPNVKWTDSEPTRVILRLA